VKARTSRFAMSARCGHGALGSFLRHPERAARLSPASGRSGTRDFYFPAWISRRRPGSNIPATSHGLRRGSGQAYRPRLRAMISLWISVVPPTIGWDAVGG
jgi:hypothetical protein